MNWIEAFLTIGLAGICLGGVFHALLALIYVRQWANRSVPWVTGDLPAVTLLRPVKAGVPELRSKLSALAEALLAGDQLVIGVDGDSPDAAVADEVRAAFPERAIVVVRCGPVGFLNPKIAKLIQMEPSMHRELVVLSDSEAIIDAAWLDVFRRDWAASGADVLTCGYRFAKGASWPQILDATPVLASLWPGLLFVRRFGKVKFTLGACTGFRRADIAAVGGWAAFGEDLAEDNRIGAALAERGRTIELSRHVVTLESDELTWRDYWRHQRRVAVTYRVCAPLGFAGLALTQSVAAAILLITLSPMGADRRGIWLAWCVAIQMARWMFLRDLAVAVRFQPGRLFVAMVISSLVETVCWVLAWFSRRVWWAGKWWRVSREGKLRAN